MKRIGIFYARLISLNSKIGRIIEAAAIAAGRQICMVESECYS
jgi:hypothetical protein